MAFTTPSRSRKGQLLTTDAAIAMLLSLAILYVAFSAYSNIAVRAHEAQGREAMLSRTISAADYLMKEGLAHKEEGGFGIPVAHSHLLERAKLDSLGNSTLANKLGLSILCIDLIRAGDATNCAGMPACIKRPAIIYETREVGFLVACAG